MWKESIYLELKSIRHCATLFYAAPQVTGSQLGQGRPQAFCLNHLGQASHNTCVWSPVPTYYSSQRYWYSNTKVFLLLLLLSHFSCVRLCATPEMAAHQAPQSLGFSRQEHWSGLPFPSPMHESEKWKWSRSVMSDPQQPHGLQPTRLLHP